LCSQACYTRVGWVRLYWSTTLATQTEYAREEEKGRGKGKEESK